MAIKCECPETAYVEPERLYAYNAVTERPYTNHAPGECLCTNELRRYRTTSGAIRWLCSCCCMLGDEELHS